MTNASPAQILADLWRAAGGDSRRARARRADRRRAGPAVLVPGRGGGAGQHRRCRHWPQPSSGGSAPDAARPSRSTCAMRRSSSAASGMRASPASRRRRCGTRSPASIAPATAAGCGCTPTSRIIATASSSCCSAPTSARRCRRRSLKWEAEKFETAAAEAKLVATMMRSPAEWAAHAQGQAVAHAAAAGDHQDRRGARPPLPKAERPLSGVRVLDLTRVIAGPVCGRTLAAHGADVMRVTAPHLPGLGAHDIDTWPRQALGRARPQRG